MVHFFKLSKPLFFIFSLILMCMALFCSLTYAGNGYVVICNSGNPITELSSTDIKNIFLGKKVTWDNGDKILFSTLKEGESNREFLRDHVKKSPQQFKNYWKQMLFTGKGVIPPSYDDDAGVIKFVSENKGAIGFISSPPSSASVKPVHVSN